MISNVAGVVPSSSPSASMPKRRVGVEPHPAGPQFGDVAVRQVGAPVDLRQRGEGVGFRARHDQHVQRAVVRLGLGRDLHAAAVEPAVGHDHVVRPPLVGLPVGVQAHGGRGKARQRQPEPGQVPGRPEHGGQPGGPGHHGPAQAGLGNVGEVPGDLGRAGGEGHPAHVDGADLVPGQTAGGRDGIARQAERPDEIAPGARRDHPEHGIGGGRLAIGDHPVDHLVHRPVAAGRHQVPLAAGQRLPGGLGGVAAMGGPHDPVADLGLGQDGFDLRQVLTHLAPPGPRVGDDHHGAERAGSCLCGLCLSGHGSRTPGFMIWPGSRAILIFFSTSSPSGPSSAARKGALSRPTP